MAIETIHVLMAQDVTVTEGASISGFRLVLNAPNWTAIQIDDAGGTFDETDPFQRLATGQTLGGVHYPAGTPIRAEYAVTLQDDLGNSYQAVAVNLAEDGPETIEAVAFVGPPGGWPPIGVELRIASLTEGPGSAGVPLLGYGDLAAPICFVTGTRIATPEGPRRVETLGAGDRVLTLDNGAQPLLWAGPAPGGAGPGAACQPVRIDAGALGDGLPERALLVSRQHRILQRGHQLDLLFGLDEALLPAAALLGLPGIASARPAGAWAYHHLLCARHEIVLAEGAPVETLLPCPAALARLPPGVHPRPAAGPCRPLLSTREGRLLAAMMPAQDRAPSGPPPAGHGGKLNVPPHWTPPPVNPI